MTDGGILTATKCLKCGTAIPAEQWNLKTMAPCPECRSEQRLDLFSAARQAKPMTRLGEPIQTGGEAACFFHDTKKAAASCSRCGRFLCALCDLDLNREHFCSGCLVSEKQAGNILQNHFTRYDGIALALVLFPLFPLFWFFTIITPFIALFVAVFFWRKPVGLFPRFKSRFILAIALAIVELAAALLLAYSIFTGLLD